MHKILPIAFSVSLLAGTALAAEGPVIAQLTEVKAPVMVDSGKGFAPVYGPVALKAGDRVMATDEGTAVISYGPDCALPVAAPEIQMIEETGCAMSTQGASGILSSPGVVIGGTVATVWTATLVGMTIDTLNDDEGEQDEDSPAVTIFN